MKDGMKKLFLLGDLLNNFMRWYNADPSWRGNWRQVKMSDSQLYINKSKFEAIFQFLTMYAYQQSDHEVPHTPF